MILAEKFQVHILQKRTDNTHSKTRRHMITVLADLELSFTKQPVEMD